MMFKHRLDYDVTRLAGPWWYNFAIVIMYVGVYCIFSWLNYDGMIGNMTV